LSAHKIKDKSLIHTP